MFRPHTRRSHSSGAKAGAFLVLGVLFLAAAPAQAATPVSSRYAEDDLVRSVYFDPSVSSGKFRSRIADAAETWKALDVAQFEVDPARITALSDNSCETLDGAFIGGIIRGPIAGNGTLAENISCINSETGQLVGFRQTYNSQYSFYTGTRNPPAKKYDLQAVATHELGHAQGWTADHYSNRNNSSLCANKGKQATMCPEVFQGNKRLRSLAPNDIQPVVSAYAAPFSADFYALGVADPPPEASASVIGTVRPGGTEARACLRGLILVVKSRGNDTFSGDAGSQLVGLAGGSDIGFSRGGDDCILAGIGDDDLRTGPGNDTAIGGGGNDIIAGGPGNDLMLGRAGNDQIYARDGSFDRIGCGDDVDSVYTADPIDDLNHCEQVPSDFTVIPLPPGYE